MSSSRYAVSVRDLEVRYTRDDGTPVKALDRVSLDIEPGEFVCILGRSGHGKTTLLNAIAGLLPSYEGVLRVMDKPVTGPGQDRGVIFQRDAVYPWMRVEDNVAFGLRVRGVGRAERLRVARERIEQVGLTPVARAWPRELSGGMRARVAIASVFANDPPLLLADEPFSALDYVTKRQLHGVLREMWRSSGKTVLFVTHDVDEALMLGTRVIIVSHGTIAENRPVKLSIPRTDDDLATPEGLALRHLMLHHIGLE